MKWKYIVMMVLVLLGIANGESQFDGSENGTSFFFFQAIEIYHTDNAKNHKRYGVLWWKMGQTKIDTKEEWEWNNVYDF